MDTLVLPVVAAGVVISLVVVLFVLSWARGHSKPCRGRQLGKYKIVGSHGASNLFTPFEGPLVEVTDYFMTAEMKPAIRETLFLNVSAVAGKQVVSSGNSGGSSAGASQMVVLANPAEKTSVDDPIKTALDGFESCEFGKAFRLYIIQDEGEGHISHEKHLIVQVGDVSKGLDFYAKHSDRDRFSLSLGPTTEHFLFGTIQTLRGTVEYEDEFKEFGPATVHIFQPSNDVSKPFDALTDKLTWLGKLAGYMPNGLSFYNIVKVLEDKKKSLQRENRRLAMENSGLTAERDEANDIVTKLTVNGGGQADLGKGKLSMAQVGLLIICPLILGISLGGLGGPSWIGVIMCSVGTVIGLGLSLVLISQRRFR